MPRKHRGSKWFKRKEPHHKGAAASSAQRESDSSDGDDGIPQQPGPSSRITTAGSSRDVDDRQPVDVVLAVSPEIRPQQQLKINVSRFVPPAAMLQRFIETSMEWQPSVIVARGDFPEVRQEEEEVEEVNNASQAGSSPASGVPPANRRIYNIDSDPSEPAFSQASTASSQPIRGVRRPAVLETSSDESEPEELQADWFEPDDFFDNFRVDVVNIIPNVNVVPAQIQLHIEQVNYANRPARLRHWHRRRPLQLDSLRNRAAGDYEGTVLYLGSFDMVCPHCNALYFDVEENARRIYSKCCLSGSVSIQRPEYPDELREFFDPNNVLHDAFMENIRRYNSAFAFASMNVDLAFPGGIPEPFCYRVHGSVRYKMAHIVDPAQRVSYANLYFLDVHEALQQRQLNNGNVLNAAILGMFDEYLREVNPYARGIMQMRQVVQNANQNRGRAGEIVLAFNPARYGDGPNYALPVENENVCAVFGSMDGNPPFPHKYTLVIRDTLETFVLEAVDSNVDPMVYPILFPRGEPGWQRNLLRARGRVDSRVSMRMFYAFMLHCRQGSFNQIFRAGKLFQQYVVDAFLKVESDRLNYLRSNQRQLRVEAYQGLIDFLDVRDVDEAVRTGRLLILPSSFVGSPRNLRQNYLDAMAVVSRFGKPSLFVTLTANPNWPELTENLIDGQSRNNRPDLIVRVFHAKLTEFVRDVTVRNIFGRCQAYVYVVEFQKRGLPHAHMLIFLHPADDIATADQIDRIVCAELPARDDPLFTTVSSLMVHGPCSERCLRDGRCVKKFPKPFREQTVLNQNGYPQYRRRDLGAAQVGFRRIDNGYIVPYNRYLLKKYNSHINVEVCSSLQSVKYLFKYIFKGQDQIRLEVRAGIPRQEPAEVNVPGTPEGVGVEEPGSPPLRDDADRAEPPVAAPQGEEYDEITQYVNARYVSACEAAWRLFDYELQDRSHSVYRLPVHLPDAQMVYYREGDEDQAVERHEHRLTMLTAWFALNVSDAGARQYLYCEIPHHYTFDSHERDADHLWKRRQNDPQPNDDDQRSSRVLVRLPMVKASDGERFYLRILLLHVRGARSFEHLRTVGDQICPTFREAALALNLLANDDEYIACLREAALIEAPKVMRQLFSYILLYSDVERALDLWQTFEEDLSLDFLRRYRRWRFMDEERARRRARNSALFHINSILARQGFTLVDFGLPMFEDDQPVQPPDGDGVAVDVPVPEAEVGDNLPLLNDEQRQIFDSVSACLRNDRIEERYFFVEGAGGTGKTFLYNAIIDHARASGLHVIVGATTGIAATLLKGGQTIHSHFKIPVPVLENTVGNVAPNSPKGEEIRAADLLIWDEVTMATRHLLNSVDRTCRDVRRVNKPFGGMTVILGGDFRQCAPIVMGWDPNDVLQACVKASELWERFQKKELRRNMRAGAAEVEFKEWLLRIGSADPLVCTPLQQSRQGVKFAVRIPPHLLTNDLIADIFGQGDIDASDVAIRNSVILCFRNVDVAEFNAKILARVRGDVRSYLSSDTIINEGNDDRGHDNFPPEFLNNLTPSGMPPHILELKVGAIVMLLRNLDPREGFCNGTRLLIRQLLDHMIVAETIDGRRAEIFIPRLDLDCRNSSIPVPLRRRQFPLQLAFSLTANKSQGQTYRSMGLYLRNPPFAHGQLYVAFSRVRAFENVRVQVRGIFDGDDQVVDLHRGVLTTNIVFRDLLD